MRPRRSTSVISAMTRPAPEFASVRRWWRGQSEATPSSALYWHMGETTIRFASSRLARRMGENRELVMAHAVMGGGEAGGANCKHRECRDGSEAPGTTIVTVDCRGRDRRP